MFHPQAELIAEPQRPRQVEPRRTDPAVQIAPLDQLEYDVWPSVDDLDRVRPDDVRVFAELHPEPAFRGEPADPDATPQQLAAQCLERNDLGARTTHLVVDHVNQAHSPFVDVEDLEPSTDPVSHRIGAHHEGNLRLVPSSLVSIRRASAFVPSTTPRRLIV